jgi:hypothetical protein
VRRVGLDAVTVLPTACLLSTAVSPGADPLLRSRAVQRVRRCSTAACPRPPSRASRSHRRGDAPVSIEPPDASIAPACTAGLARSLARALAAVALTARAHRRPPSIDPTAASASPSRPSAAPAPLAGLDVAVSPIPSLCLVPRPHPETCATRRAPPEPPPDHAPTPARRRSGVV